LSNLKRDFAWRFAAGLLAGLCGEVSISREPALAQPRPHTIGLALTDGVAVAALPPHLRTRHGLTVEALRTRMRQLLLGLERSQVVGREASFSANRFHYHGRGDVDFVVHVVLTHADKVFRNQVIYGNQLPRALPLGYGGQEAGLDYEVVSLPAIRTRFEIRLIDPHREKVIWSAQRDTTATVAFDPQTFILNTRKYPGMTPPRLLQENLADLMRLRQANRSADRLLDVADRWFVSKPAADVKAVQEVLENLVQSLAMELDCNLPLEGIITRLIADGEGESRAELDLGSRHGLAPALRLEVWRPLPAAQKVGELEVVSVDSTTATARLRKLDRKIRKQGESLQVLDRVISPKRPTPTGRRTNP